MPKDYLALEHYLPLALMDLGPVAVAVAPSPLPRRRLRPRTDPRDGPRLGTS